MNSDNNALQRTYFLGGPPRVGKSIIAFALADKVHGHVVSTDAIRNAARKTSFQKDGDLFIVEKTETVSEKEWIENHLNNPKKIVEYQNRESKALWSSIESFCNSFCEDDTVHIVEGVAIISSLVAGMKNKPENVVFVGNTSENHLKSLLEHVRDFPRKDWMSALGYSEERIEAMASFIKEMSLYFKSEAEKYGFPYFEISDDNFQSSIGSIVEKL
ncbi:MAG: hypothetical protein COU07_00990 [Candidatus Harrisonbacteria bacterium CG10_big_fil_rev_8_21_14_0_10_40_38]|uniref:Uncharacterized protein n=1 Tax=Candidatus Harrisonbacteria bacterium CG10_big_fil_rev_8_21_14_0_10_40_38 TaxID=1974583 RepID=A0A2H0USU8_9BACT|nr:MAG: hypothetical protein COU07_00990 [Candidatus Harrisonbacteria bacterium CG10_big_fil_rev_8_21_14_0_10_40_38]